MCSVATRTSSQTMPHGMSRGSGKSTLWGWLQGNWTPGHFRPTITLAGKLALMVAMMVRGIDYAAGDTVDTARRLATVEAAAPLWLWGASFCLAATLGFVGMIIHRREMVFQAHLAGWALYWALGIGVCIDVYGRSPDPSAGMYPILIVLAVGVVIVALTLAKGAAYYDWWVVSVWVGAVALGLSSLGLDGIRSGISLLVIGAIHMLMAIGTAEVATRSNIEKARLYEQDSPRRLH